MAADARTSKALSYWLRHRPDAAGLDLDSAGWAPVDRVLAALSRAGLPDKLDALRQLVAASDKQRFELSADCTHIRARQGHSIPIELGLEAVAPPDQLFHGTVERFLASILAEGLKPMARHHVHLSPDEVTARQVGARRGKPIILRIDARRMAADGHEFFLSGNGVWLSERVPPSYLEVIISP